MSRFLESGGLITLLAAGVLAGCSAGGGGGGRGELINLSACPANLDTAALAAEAVRLTNQERAALGIPELTSDVLLTTAARNHAQAMATQGFAGHENPYTGDRVGDRVTEAGYVWSLVAENLEFGACSAEQAVQDWMNSQAHREHVLDPSYQDVGIAVYQGGAEDTYWVQVFASP